jgi:hypothetical protein
MDKFVIYTYDYSPGVGGIKVMHKLCDMLNANGSEAYLMPIHIRDDFYTCSDYNTPLITQEVFDIVWHAYLKELEVLANRKISSFIKERSYEIVAADRVKLNFYSNLEKEMFEAERLTVLPFFRGRLKNNTFEFEYEISNNNPTENRLLTAEQKFKLMAQKNPLLSDLQRIFELQIEY